MTIEHLLAMQGGIGSTFDTPGIEGGMKRYNGRATTVQMAECIAEDPLYFDPGQGFRYGLCHDVAGAVASAATGKPLCRLADELILRPLGMEDVTFHPSEAQMDRLAAVYEMRDGVRVNAERHLNAVCSMPEYDSGGGGLMGNVDAFIRLADALANGGIGENGARILKAETIEDIRRNRQIGKSMEDFKRVRHKRGYGYGLGVRTLLDPDTSRSPVGEFGWDGAAGAWALMDPQNRIAAVYAQHMIDYLDTYYIFHPTIRDLMYEGLGL
jgi:CubicO group peptidase (beta-lactamase class C family)